MECERGEEGIRGEGSRGEEWIRGEGRAEEGQEWMQSPSMPVVQ